MSSRLLLDENLTHQISTQLAARGVDAAAVTARPDLRELGDAEILEAAAAEGRVLVTRNIKDFVPLNEQWGAGGRQHPGIILIASSKFPETPAFIGQAVEALDEWVAAGHDITGTIWFL